MNTDSFGTAVEGGGVNGPGTSPPPSIGGRALLRRQRGPSSVSTISSSASQAAAAEGGRSAGSFSSRPQIQSDTPASRSARMTFGGGGTSLTWRRRIAVGASVSANGSCPVKSS